MNPKPTEPPTEAETTQSESPNTRRRSRRIVIFGRLPVYAGLLAVLLTIAKIDGCAERLFYYPVREKYGTPYGAEDVWFESDGRLLHGWFYHAVRPEGETGPAPTVVHAHGNAFNIGRHRDFVEFLPREGFNVLIFDYRAYGKSQRGPLHREGLITDAKAAIEYALTRDDVDPERLGMYGLSLGGTIGLAASADDDRVRAVVSVATFSTWRGVAGDYLWLLGRWLIPAGRDAVDSAASLGDRPLLLLHGTADPIVRHRHAPLIHDAATAAGVDSTFLSFEGVGHVDWVDEERAMRDAIGAFFVEHLGAGGSHP